MAGTRFYFQGMEDLKTALNDLPAELRGEADHIVEEEANAAAVAIRRVYVEHVASGRLLRGLTVVEKPTGRFGAKFVVRSASPIAWIFDNGSQARHWKTGKATGAMWGHTPNPPTHTFSRNVRRGRAVMLQRLVAMLRRYGLNAAA